MAGLNFLIAALRNAIFHPLIVACEECAEVPESTLTTSTPVHAALPEKDMPGALPVLATHRCLNT